MAQAYATDADLVGTFTELSGVAPGLRTFYIELATTMIALQLWGVKASMAHMLLAAHMIASHPGVTIPGVEAPVTGRSFSEMSTSYAQPTGMPEDGELARTPYGRNLIALRGGVFVGPIATGAHD